MTFSPLLVEELEAITEAGLYESREAFLSHAVETLFAARPDLREAVACKLYEKGVFSLGRAAEWARVSIDDLKEALHRFGVSREAPEGPAEVEAMALAAIQKAGEVCELIQDVVLDTDFLSSFLKIDRLQLVRDFYQVETLQVPPAVYGEVRQTRIFPKLAMLPWLRVMPPGPRVQEKLSLEPGFNDFGAGEKEAIALAKQLDGSVLLMSDNRARLWATGIGLHSLGIPGFLLACKRTLLVDSQEIAALVLALEEKDRYRFRKDVLDLLLS